jgi:hypothetical protein
MMKNVEFGSLFTFIRNGMNVKQDKEKTAFPLQESKRFGMEK